MTANEISGKVFKKTSFLFFILFFTQPPEIVLALNATKKAKGMP